MNANEILTAAVATLDQRGKDYDQPEGERSMGRIVGTFNALTGLDLTEAQGWQFMAVLKLVRMGTASDPTDSAVDCAAYAALAGEALARDRERFDRKNRAALKEAQAAASVPDADGWIAWGGGKCPVSICTWVDVKFRNGSQILEVAGSLWWDHGGRVGPTTDREIVAYRVYKPEAPAAENDGPWKPKEGELYYCLDADGYIYSTTFYDDYPPDSIRFAFGNCFRTREEAEEKRAKIIGGK